MTAAAILGALLVASPHGWTLTHARQVLASKTYTVTDTTQADQPQYQLRFSSRAAGSLRRGFVFDGPAHDLLTDTELRVRFTFKRPGRIVNRFEGFADSELVAQAAQNAGAGRRHR